MNIKDVWNEQYSDMKETALQDKNLFKLESDAIKNKIKSFIAQVDKKEINILELGSGTGFLASIIIREFASNNITLNYTGVDFSSLATEKANSRKLENSIFLENDFIDFLKTTTLQYDIILTQRAIMAIMEEDKQNLMLGLIIKKLDGIGIFSECTEEGFLKLNALRRELNVNDLEKVWHSRYLSTQQLDKYFKNYIIEDFSSMYYLITRVIYPMFEEPHHNTPLADFAASLKQDGEYSFLKLIIIRKESNGLES